MSQNLFLESAEIQWAEEAIFAKVESKTGLKIGEHHDEVSITEVFDLDFRDLSKYGYTSSWAAAPGNIQSIMEYHLEDQLNVPKKSYFIKNESLNRCA